MEVKRLPLLTATAAAALASLPAVVAAQVAPEAPDRDELVTFAEAFVEVTQVRQEITPRIQQAQSPQEASELQAEADERMLGILEDHELDANRYNEIIQLVSTDEELRTEFEEVLAEVSGPGG